MSEKKNYYAVKVGLTPGIYKTWDECKSNVHGYPGAIYKGFKTLEEAEAFMNTGEKQENASVLGNENNIKSEAVAYVDGSFDAGSGRFSCGVVICVTDADGNTETTEFNAAFDDEEAAKQRNVAGEVMGSKLAIEYCLKNGINKVEIYHDYEGIGAWADRRWKANNPLTQGYRDFVAEARQNMDISFVKVKAHAGNKYNELADRLAKKSLGM